MDLRQLRYFTHVIDEEGVQKASQLAGVTQPAITAAVRNLEQEFGAKLFRKIGRKLEPTAKGLLLYEKAKLLLAHADDLKDDLRASVASSVSILRVGAPALIANFVLADAMLAFMDENPKVRLQLSQMSGPEAESRLLAGQLDVCFSTRSPKAMRIDAIPLVKRSIAAYVDEKHPLAGEATIIWEQVFDYPIVSLPPGYVLSDRISQIAQQLRLHADFLLQSDAPSLIQNAMHRSNSVGLLLEGAPMADHLKAIRIDSPGSLAPFAELTVSIFQSAEARPTEGRQLFTDHMQRYLAN